MQSGHASRLRIGGNVVRLCIGGNEYRLRFLAIARNDKFWCNRHFG